MTQHSENSSYREKLIEHLFIGELLKLSWTRKDCSLEISKPEVDRAGYDVIAEANGVVRHIQLKASFIGSRTITQKVHIKLGEKPSGCIIWIYFDQDTLQLGPFLFFGGSPNQPLPDISARKIAKHTKSDKDGNKAERPNIRELNKTDFRRYDTIESLYDELFGQSVASPTGSIFKVTEHE